MPHRSIFLFFVGLCLVWISTTSVDRWVRGRRKFGPTRNRQPEKRAENASSTARVESTVNFALLSGQVGDVTMARLYADSIGYVQSLEKNDTLAPNAHYYHGVVERYEGNMRKRLRQIETRIRSPFA